ncbi:phage tail tape measure protein [Pseudomonas sp. MDMC_285]|nr:phage tail tape measure protein [Pseudomonas sp. MDMC_285]
MAANLGTLTLDLVARIGGFTGPLDKAARESQKKMADIKKSADIAGKAIAGLAVATATGLAVLTVNTVRAANEVSRLAQVSNSSTEEFQRYAAGAQAVGIEQDKLGDIFKDVNDKVGDFLQTGGGALADFFENVAPKVGVTADQFRKLSGPEALGLYVSSLEKAGASQQDMTFYLEAIASDATALLPLLKNNAEGFKLLGDQAAAAGAILDNETIRAATELQAVSILTGQAMDGLRNQIAAGLLPVLSGLAEEFYGAAQGGANFKDVGEFVGETLKFIASAAVGAYTSFQLVGKGIAGLAYIASQIPDGLDAVKQAVGEVGDELDSTAQSAANAIDRINSAGEGDARGGMVSRLADLLEQTSKRGKTAGIVIDQTANKTKKATDAIQSQIEALQLQAATVGMSTREQTLFKLALDGATQSQLDQAEAALNAVDAFDKVKKQQEDYKSLVADLRTDEERRLETLRAQMAVLDAMSNLNPDERRKQAGRVTEGLFEGADAPTFSGVDAGPLGELSKLDDAEKELQDWYDKQLEMLATFRQERSDLNDEWDAREREIKQQHEESLAAIERSRWQVGLESMDSFLTQIQTLRETDSKKGKQAAKAAAIVQATINAYTAATGAYASASAIPVVGWVLGPVAAAAALAAGLANVSAIQGMAHDGIDSVPQTGTWLLEKGERVTTAGTSAKLDATLSRIQAGMNEEGASRTGSRGNFTLNQTNNFGSPDNRTANQVASATARRQRAASARLGS